MLKKIYLFLILSLGFLNSAISQTFPNASWHYYVPVAITGGAINQTAEVDVDFASLLTSLGSSGTFDPLSVRVVRPNGTMSTIQEFTDRLYAGVTDAAGNNRGEVKFLLEDAGNTTYLIYFDIIANGPKAANPQTPINGNFEKGTTGQAQPTGWNAPTKQNATYDAQIRPSETPNVNGTPTNGTPFSGDFSYLLGDRTTDGITGGAITARITKTITVPTTNPGNLVFKYRVEGWDSSANGANQWDYFQTQIVTTGPATTTTIVAPLANNYLTYPFSPNLGTGLAANNSGGYGPYNGWDFGTGKTHRSGMTIAKGSEPWFTVTKSLIGFEGKTVTLNFYMYQNTQYRTWVHIDDVEWSLITGVLGTPVEYGTSRDATNFDCLETGTNTPFNSSNRKPLYTKITDQAFSFDIIALKSTGAIETNYVAPSASNKTVTVELFDATTPTTCSSYASPLATTTATFTSSNSGRVTIPNITLTKAAPKLLCRIKDTNKVPNVYGCSTDTFTVRPQSITNITSSANADLTGTSSTSTPTTIAGDNFTITADTGKVGYNGVPTINNLLLEWPTAPIYGVPQTSNGVGSVTGSFSTPATTATGNNASGNFIYSEAGYFRFQPEGLYDSSFVTNSGDDINSDCIAGSFLNTLSGGKYGCNFGNTIESNYIGRFIPAGYNITSFSIINRVLNSCIPSSTFTYLDEPFDITFNLTPVNKSNQTTLNYYRSNFINTAASSFGITATNNLTSRVRVLNITDNWNVVGVLSNTLRLNVGRTTNPDGPFLATKINIAPKDSDNVTVLSSVMDIDTNADSILDSKTIGATDFYFGRLKIGNYNGSELLSSIIPLEVGYYTNYGFVTNTNDNCTSLNSAMFTKTNFTGNLTAGVLSYVYPGTFVNGKQTLTINKPTGGSGLYNGAFSLGYNLSGDNKSYLLGKWSSSTYTDNPRALINLSKQAVKKKVLFFGQNF